jgi:chemotaxis protein histidine kinase CheA
MNSTNDHPQDLNLTHNMSFDQIECSMHKLKEHLAWMILCKDKVSQNKVNSFLDWHKHMKGQVANQKQMSKDADRKMDLDLLMEQLDWLAKRLSEEFTVKKEGHTEQMGQMGGAAKKAKKAKSKSKSKSKGKKASAKPKTKAPAKAPAKAPTKAPAKAPAKAKATKSKSKSKSKSKGKTYSAKRA